MSQELPFVSLIVPCRNESGHILECLQSLCSNEYPEDRFEVVVVDGMSSDGTREAVMDFCARHPNVRLVDNPLKLIPVAMNTGIRHSRGEIIAKTDAHSIFPRNFISTCVEYLTTSEADNVGGVLRMIPPDQSRSSLAIVLAQEHPLGAGGAPHLQRGGQPHYADTAAFGCFRRSLFDRIGFYNESAVRGCDTDLNIRIQRGGGKILVIPDLVISYYPAPGLVNFIRRNARAGFWVLRGFAAGQVQSVRLRHLVPLVAAVIATAVAAGALFIPALRPVFIVSALLYAALVVGVSAVLAVKRSDPFLFFHICAAFTLRHWAYATGSLFAILTPLRTKQFWEKMLGRQPSHAG